MDDYNNNLNNQDAAFQGSGTGFQPAQSGLPDMHSPNMDELKQKVISLPAEAMDTDLIEKEWVEALQAVAVHTSADPYTQQKEISRIKADYMHKRYGRAGQQGGD